jgi:hypothetical protein
VIGNSLGILAL